MLPPHLLVSILILGYVLILTSLPMTRLVLLFMLPVVCSSMLLIDVALYVVVLVMSSVLVMT